MFNLLTFIGNICFSLVLSTNDKYIHDKINILNIDDLIPLTF